MNKAVISNLVSATLILIGLLLAAPAQSYVLNMGLFALSGGITNWLAVYMLFERVPGIYGSGVIPLQFEEFKRGIRELIMEQFFNEENLREFFTNMADSSDKMERKLKESVAELDLGSAFEALVDVIVASSFGSMLGMFGGKEALAPLKEPFIEKMHEFMATMFEKESFQAQLREGLTNAADSESLKVKIQELIDSRLDKMTPQIVKEIIQKMIREHLGWLVVWGCVFGGLVGLLVTLLGQL